MNTLLKGAALGALSLLVEPLWLAITLPLALLLGGPFVFLAASQATYLILVAYFAKGREFPWWMLTPDDTKSPFGQYEAAVRRVYDRFGRFAGDVYWLGLRNILYGLAYYFKPQKYKETTDYAQFPRSVKTFRWGNLYTVDGLQMAEVFIGPIRLLAGWKIDGVIKDPFTTRQAVNMEFRPVFSFRAK